MAIMAIFMMASQIFDMAEKPIGNPASFAHPTWESRWMSVCAWNLMVVICWDVIQVMMVNFGLAMSLLAEL